MPTFDDLTIALKRLSEEIEIIFEPGYAPESFPWVREVFPTPWKPPSVAVTRRRSHCLIAYSVDAKKKVVRAFRLRPHDLQTFEKRSTSRPMEAVRLDNLQVRTHGTPYTGAVR